MSAAGVAAAADLEPTTEVSSSLTMHSAALSLAAASCTGSRSCFVLAGTARLGHDLCADHGSDLDVRTAADDRLSDDLRSADFLRDAGVFVDDHVAGVRAVDVRGVSFHTAVVLLCAAVRTATGGDDVADHIRMVFAVDAANIIISARVVDLDFPDNVVDIVDHPVGQRIWDAAYDTTAVSGRTLRSEELVVSSGPSLGNHCHLDCRCSFFAFRDALLCSDYHTTRDCFNGTCSLR